MLHFGGIPFSVHKVRKKREDFIEQMCYYTIAESRANQNERGRCQGHMKKVTPKQVVEELAAIGFAKATDFLRISDGELTVCNTDTLTKADRAAIASIERGTGGIKVKFYDKMKALELLGKYMGMFDGRSDEQEKGNNLLEAILAATGEDVELDDIPEIQQAAAACHDLVEPSGAEGL